MCIDIEEILYKGLAYMIMETEKSQGLPFARRRGELTVGLQSTERGELTMELQSTELQSTEGPRTRKPLSKSQPECEGPRIRSTMSKGRKWMSQLKQRE